MSEITGQQAVGRLMADWSAARAALAEIERVEHPDITDKFGRVWTWKSKDLYRHCGTAAPADMIDGFALPTQAALDNPNYDLCDVCVDGRERNVPDCKPEWNCSHTMHAAPAAVPDVAITKSVSAQLDAHPRGHLVTRDRYQSKGAPTRYQTQIMNLAVGDTLAGFGKVLEFAELAPEGGYRMFRMVTEHPQTYPVRTNVIVRPGYVHFGITALADGGA